LHTYPFFLTARQQELHCLLFARLFIDDDCVVDDLVDDLHAVLMMACFSPLRSTIFGSRDPNVQPLTCRRPPSASTSATPGICPVLDRPEISI
jgi:hypothetical protein